MWAGRGTMALVELTGCRALVTGASRGIGAAVARRLAERGANVALVARDVEALGKVAASCGGTVYAADLARADSIRALVARVEADAPIDVLVNNAGVDLAGDFLTLDAAAIDELFACNVVAPVLLARAIVPGMVARARGHVVNVSSLSAVSAVPGLAPYSASKAALSHFTAALRAECKGAPVGTTLVELGPVRTDMVAHVRSHRPTDRAFRRFERLGVLPSLDPTTCADAIVRAVEGNRRHVRLPRRAALFPMLAEAPRRLTELFLAGVRPR